MMTISSCKNPEEPAVKITRTITTSAVSSGSGLAIHKGTLYVIGDDAEYAGIASIEGDDFSITNLYPGAPQHRISKPLKHDLEAATVAVMGNDTFILAFGSGGISPYRDTLFAINTNNSNLNFQYSLLDLYNAIRTQAGLETRELNIEGATIAGNKLMLLNRGKNFLVVISWDEFARYLMHDGDLPRFKILPVSLPVVNDYPVGFSGVCTLNDEQLLFTASLEETTDFIKDGTVKGSYIGLLDITNNSAIVRGMTALQGNTGNLVLDKLESIDIVTEANGMIKAVAVADNDDGTSKLFYLDIDVDALPDCDSIDTNFRR